MKIKVYEIRLKLYVLTDITYEDMLSVETSFIDSALARDEKWLEYHETNCYKNYVFNGMYPVEKDGIYKKDNIYTIIIRTVNEELAIYFSKVLRNHYTKKLKGLTVENRIIPKKMISEIYSLTPVIMKSENGYWRDKISLDEYERQLFENVVKKYNEFTNQKIEEDFDFYTYIKFINKKPIANLYKGKIKLLGDKVSLKIADNEKAQELAYFVLGTGLGTSNSRGYGYCNYVPMK